MYGEVKQASMGKDGPITIQHVSVLDPVCGVTIEWDTGSKKAIVTHLQWSPSMDHTSWVRNNSFAPYTSHENGIDTRVENLGTRTILGVKAVGTRFTTIMPAGSSWHNQGPITRVSEKWDSPDLQIMVGQSWDDPLISEVRRNWEMTRLNRTDPDPSLFRIPPGYTIEDRYVGLHLETAQPNASGPGGR